MANARHSNAGRFVQQRLFAGLSAFVELDRRLADLPDEKSRGDAFEVFTEAYLATQRKHDAETVWPLSSVPTEILGSLQLATQDYGVDGVLKTRPGKFSACQVKFRTGRPGLTWRELSTFMGLADSPNIHSRSHTRPKRWPHCCRRCWDRPKALCRSGWMAVVRCILDLPEMRGGA
jgi:hypothetical protein